MTSLTSRHQLARHRRADEPAGSRDEDPVSGVELHSRARVQRALGHRLANFEDQARPPLGAGQHILERVREELDLVVPRNQGRQKLDDMRLSAATCVRMRCRWKSGVTTIWGEQGRPDRLDHFEAPAQARGRGFTEDQPDHQSHAPYLVKELVPLDQRLQCLGERSPRALQPGRGCPRRRRPPGLPAPATIASWLVLKVEECTTARSMELYTASDTAAVESMAPTGT